MKGKIKTSLIVMIMALSMVLSVFAVVTPTSPTSDEITNVDVYDFTATTDNPLVTGGVHIDLELDSVRTMPCVWTGAIYDCSILAVDISGLEGIYEVNMTDGSGSVLAATLTIDQAVTANDFGFSATNYVVNYTPDCDCTPSGCDALSTGDYSFENGSWTSFVSGNDFTTIEGAGDYEFRGYCLDNAGNEDYTGITAFTLPASPPVLTGIISLPSTTMCGTPAVFPCTESLDGSGLPIDLALRLTFDKEAIITITFDSGAPIGPSGSFDEHVISLISLTEGSHLLSIEASDGINLATYDITFDVTNTGGTGGIDITIRNSIPVTPEVAAIEFIAPTTTEKNDILPGDFAIVRYTLFMVNAEYTRFSFAGDTDFSAPVTVFCNNNYDPITKDIITPGVNDYTIDVLDGSLDETKAAITCPIETGNIDEGMIYEVLVKYPISTDAIGGTMNGVLSVGLYDTLTQPQCNNGIDDDLDTFIDLADPQCTDLADNDESA